MEGFCIKDTFIEISKFSFCLVIVLCPSHLPLLPSRVPLFYCLGIASLRRFWLLCFGRLVLWFLKDHGVGCVGLEVESWNSYHHE